MLDCECTLQDYSDDIWFVQFGGDSFLSVWMYEHDEEHFKISRKCFFDPVFALLFMASVFERLFSNPDLPSILAHTVSTFGLSILFSHAYMIHMAPFHIFFIFSWH